MISAEQWVKSMNQHESNFWLRWTDQYESIWIDLINQSEYSADVLDDFMTQINICK